MKKIENEVLNLLKAKGYKEGFLKSVKSIIAITQQKTVQAILKDIEKKMQNCKWYKHEINGIIVPVLDQDVVLALLYDLKKNCGCK